MGKGWVEWFSVCSTPCLPVGPYKKKQKVGIVSLSVFTCLPVAVQIYGAVTMNNTMCLGIFLVIVYFRGLMWDFSAEVSVILFATLVMGGIAAVRTTFPLWMAFIGLALYPASIGFVAFLDYVCGWH